MAGPGRLEADSLRELAFQYPSVEESHERETVEGSGNLGFENLSSELTAFQCLPAGEFRGQETAVEHPETAEQSCCE